MNFSRSLFLLFLAVPGVPASSVGFGDFDLGAPVEDEEATKKLQTDIHRRMDTVCLGTQGQTSECGSWFSGDYSCPGTCCHDDFNSWCCPENMQGSKWTCNGVYQNPGDNQYCNVTTSCACNQVDATVFDITPIGSPDIQRLTNLQTTFCCQDASCEELGTTTFTNTETVSWSETLSIGASATFNTVPAGETGVNYGLNVGYSYTNGKATTNTVSLSSEIICSTKAGPVGVLYQTACQVIQYSQSFDVTYYSCNEQYNTTMKITGEQLNGKCVCSDLPCDNYMDTHSCIEWFDSNYQCPTSTSTVTVDATSGSDSTARSFSPSECDDHAKTILAWGEYQSGLPPYYKELQRTSIENVEHNSEDGSCTTKVKLDVVACPYKGTDTTLEYELKSATAVLEKEMKDSHGATLSSIDINEVILDPPPNTKSSKKSKQNKKLKQRNIFY